MLYTTETLARTTDTPPKKKRSALRLGLSAAAVLLTAAVLFTCLSPLPVAWVIRAAFRKGVAVPPQGFEGMQQRVDVTKNLSYPSQYLDNQADIFLPKDRDGPVPVVLWVHGGAFVGGSKEDVEIYATALAAEGIAVVSMNYRRAPEAAYPTPLIQVEEAYRWMAEIADTYSFDLGRFALAGDSAGAHIVAQFAAMQSNADYAAEMGFEQIVPPDMLKAVLLFCGPYDVAGITEGSNTVMNFLMGRAAWAYFGERGFSEALIAQATLSNHVTGSFPPAFITDGNNMSFEPHGRSLAAALTESGVSVETYFVPAEVESVGHEYQFIMNTPAGEESFRRVIQFLEKYL